MNDTLIKRLLACAPTADVALEETHISWVLLIGDYAYKIKKPVKLGFLDFSTLAKREFYCKEELRLNRRLAPELYLSVIPITGSAQSPQLAGAGDCLEYAVKMRRFSQQALFTKCLEQQRLTATHIDRLAELLADFHASCERTSHDNGHGRPEVIQAAVMENFVQISSLIDSDNQSSVLALRAWSETAFNHLRARLDQRKHDGFVRECHGDLHLGNIVLINEQPVPFDGIEFNEQLRWIDVISEIAFTLMDLTVRGKPDWGYRLLNRYLSSTGDYQSLELLNYYQVYRAMVRAKIALLTHVGTAVEKVSLWRQFEQHLQCAEQFTHLTPPQLLICCGLSGSGKSFVAARLVEKLLAIVLSSDIERKRLAGFKPLDQTRSSLSADIYSLAFTDKTYRHLADTAASILTAGYSVLIDATCLTYAQRQSFINLARRLNAPVTILAIQAPKNVLRQRVKQRLGNDPSEADISVLQSQWACQEPLRPDESAWTINTSRDDLEKQLDALVKHLQNRSKPS